MDISSVLFGALASLDSQSAEALMSRGADINSFTDLGEGVWSYVVPSGAAATKLAIQYGADLGLIDGAGRNALYWAINSMHEEIIKILIDAGADVEQRARDEYCNLLHEVALSGDCKMMVALLRYAPSRMLNEKNVFGRTPYEEAVANGNIACAKIINEASTGVTS